MILSGHVPDWDGEFVRVSPTVDITIALSDIQVFWKISNHELYILDQGFSLSGSDSIRACAGGMC